jgi:integrase
MSTLPVLEIPKKRGKYGEGSCYQRQDNGRWEISFYDNEGRRRRQSFSTETKARKALQRQLTLKDAGKLDAPEGRTKIDALAESYKVYARNSAPKSADWIDMVWRVHLEPFFGGYLAARIDTDKLQRYIAERQEAGAKNSTINRELAILKAMLNYGAESDPPKIFRVPKFPPKLKEPEPRSGFLTDEQYQKLQKHSKHRWLRAFMAVAYTFGFRKQELLGLRVRHVDLKGRTIHLLPGETKNDKGRTVVMTEEVYGHLSKCVHGKKPNDAVFTWANGDPVLDFRTAWANMCKAAGVQILLHDFRRTAVRNMVRAGVSENVAMKISGHKTRSVFDRYDITSESDLMDAAKKLESRIGRKLATENSQPNQQSTSD